MKKRLKQNISAFLSMAIFLSTAISFTLVTVANSAAAAQERGTIADIFANTPGTNTALATTKIGAMNTKAAFLGTPVFAPDQSSAPYQWYRVNGNKTSNGVPIAGATAKRYTPTALDLGSYLYCTAGGQVLGPVPVFAQDRMVTVNLFSGTAQVDSKTAVGIPIYLSQTGYKFNTNMIAPGGKFRIRYTGASRDLKLCFANWTTNSWVAVPSTAAGSGYLEFSFEDCAKLYGNDFSSLSAIYIQDDSKTAVITSLDWIGYDTGEVMHVVPWTQNDSTTAAAEQTNVGYLYLGHVGGDFDATKVTEDGNFYLFYAGTAANKLYLSLSSYSSGDESTAKSQAIVEPVESGSLGDGRYWGRIPVSEMVKQFGTNFGRLDQIRFYLHAGVTVKTSSVHLYYTGGVGAPVEKNPTDTKWTNKTHKDGGIAFLGDSIIHNPLVSSAVGLTLDMGDWNTILGRKDCDNYGIGGETSTHIKNRVAQLLADDCNYRQIVTLFGINDLTMEANDQMALNRLIQNYTSIFETVKSSPKKPKDGMFVISILPTAPTRNEGYQNRIVLANEALKALCSQYDFITFVNCYDALKYTGTAQLPGCSTNEPHGDPKYFLSDALHPNALGYAEIAKILNPLLGGNYTVAAP